MGLGVVGPVFRGRESNPIPCAVRPRRPSEPAPASALVTQCSQLVVLLHGRRPGPGSSAAAAVSWAGRGGARRRCLSSLSRVRPWRALAPRTSAPSYCDPTTPPTASVSKASRAKSWASRALLQSRISLKVAVAPAARFPAQKGGGGVTGLDCLLAFRPPPGLSQPRSLVGTPTPTPSGDYPYPYPYPYPGLVPNLDNVAASPPSAGPGTAQTRPIPAPPGPRPRSPPRPAPTCRTAAYL